MPSFNIEKLKLDLNQAAINNTLTTNELIDFIEKIGVFHENANVYPDIIEAYKTALAKNLMSPELSKAFQFAITKEIQIAHQRCDRKRAIQAYEDAIFFNLTDERIHSCMLNVSISFRDFEQAKKTYVLAKKFDQANDDVRHRFQVGLGLEIYNKQNKTVVNIKRSKELFEFAQNQKLCDHNTYVSYIFAASYAHDFQEVKRVYKLSLDLNETHPKIFSAFITSAGESHHFSEASMAYEHAKKINKANTVLHFVFLVQAAKAKNSSAAKNAYSCLLSSTTLIQNKFTEAKKGFETLREHNMLDENLISEYIDLAKAANLPDEAKIAYELGLTLGFFGNKSTKNQTSDTVKTNNSPGTFFKSNTRTINTDPALEFDTSKERVHQALEEIQFFNTTYYKRVV